MKKQEYRIRELNGEFTIETKLEKIRYEGFFGQTKVREIEWRGVTIHGHPLWTIRAPRMAGSINNYELKLGPLKSKEVAVQKIKEFLTEPVFYDGKGMPLDPMIPETNIPKYPSPPTPPPARHIGDE